MRAEDLPAQGLGAKACGEIDDRASRAVVEPSLEANATERRIPSAMPIPTSRSKPLSRHASPQGGDLHPVTNLDRHAHRRRGVVDAWHWIVEDRHHQVAGELLKVAS